MKQKVFNFFRIAAPLGVLGILVIVFYWKYFFRDLVPFPGDLLVGAYYPWLSDKFGFAVGVPVKNSLISDIFSQFYIWKDFIAQSWVNLELPLWNPFNYAGQPLLANFNSGAMNPFNGLLILLGSIDGWAFLVMVQALGSALSMYLFLKNLRFSTVASIGGAVVYAFGGFSLLWSQFVNAGYAMIWAPLILLVIERGLEKNKLGTFLYLSPLFFLVVVAGHLQILIYTAIVAVIYFIYRGGLNSRKAVLTFLGAIALAVGVSMIQLLPTIELSSKSIRFNDDSALSVNNGLLPSGNLITLIAPDFFGNPSTMNFWGFLNYHETTTYAGVVGFIALVIGMFRYKKLKQSKFFFVLAIVALLFQFDTFLGRSIYLFKVPLLWTCFAGRIGFVYLLAVSVLTAEMILMLGEFRKKDIVKFLVLPFLMITTALLIVYVSNYAFSNSLGSEYLTYNVSLLKVAMRNLVVPAGLLLVSSFIFIFLGRFEVGKWMVVGLIVADLFRFGWKYLPMVPKTYFYPMTPEIEFLKKQEGVFRIDREKSELLPPNTWMAYRLMSPSGYDPMALLSYVRAYNRTLNKENNDGVARYSELQSYDATDLGKYNVAYLLAIKRNDEGKIPGDNIYYKIDEEEWERVFETESVAVLKNSKIEERARIVDEDGKTTDGVTKISSYSNNEVRISFDEARGKWLLLADSYYPGWRAYVNGKETKVENVFSPFRAVDIQGLQKGEVVFVYQPFSVVLGKAVSVMSTMIWIFWFGVGLFRDFRKRPSV